MNYYKFFSVNYIKKNKLLFNTILFFDIFLQLIFIPIFIFLILFLIVFFRSKNNKKFFFGPEPIINNKYWANSLKEKNFQAETWVVGYFSQINKSSDFDKVIFAPLGFLKIYYFFISLVKFDIFVFSFEGGLLGKSIFWRLEPWVLKKLNKKMIIIPFGYDFYQYSKIEDLKRRHTLISDYPERGSDEKKISSKVNFWTKKANVIIPGYLIEGLGRWDMLPYSPICIDTHNFKRLKKINQTDGLDPKNPIIIVHSPNHRIIKGSEFIINAINKLKEEGYFLKFEILEKKQNSEVRNLLMKSDILIDQIHSGYALSAMEGMASGCVVISNITRKPYEDIMRTFSFLDECPIVSVDNFDLIDQLRLLIQKPDLRNSLSVNSQEYVRKYHSYHSSCDMFLMVLKYFSKEINREELLNYYHPILGKAHKSSSKIITELVKNKIEF